MPQVQPKSKPTADPTKPVEVKAPLTPDTQVICVRFSPCGQQLAAAAFDGTVRRWDVTAPVPVELPHLTGHDGWVSSIAFHPDKRRMYSADSWGRVVCWDYTQKQPKKLWEIASAHDGWARMIAVHPDGSALVSCGRDGHARIWDAASGKKVRDLAVGADALSLAFHPAGALLIGTLLGVVQQWDAAAGKVVRKLELTEMYRYERIQDVGGVRCFTFGPGGKSLYCGGAVPKTGGFVQAVPLLVGFDWATGKRVSEWKGVADAEGFVHDMRTDAAGNIQAVTSGQPGQGRVFFWKPGQPQPHFVVAKPNCHSLDVSPDGSRLAVATTNANSSGNGRVKSKEGDYPANHSPIVFWNLPKPA